MSGITAAKAMQIARDGQITEEPTARVFRVKTYTVVIGRGPDICTCQAGQRGIRCSHARAARLVLAEQRQEPT
jgi:hypothetical protein